MRRKRHRPIFVRKCDYCGTQLQLNEPNSDSYVVTAEHKYFCKIHHVGEEPIKDCLEDYIRSKKNVQKKEKESSLWTQQKVGFQDKENEKEKVLTDRKTAIRKLDELKQFLNKKKQASFQKRPS
jgi:hypothetical protein|tara:strand:- start:326 stop:697 length:372 start_codon:yes stop_codon:yes gene_type:complete